jgi:ABC-2 type transport system ATP-binding protein
VIEVKNVTKKYGNFYAVRNISFQVEDGEIVGFLGRNGAGKTTTMNMITGYIEPTDGQIIVNGYDIDRKPKKVKELIGYMPEGVPLYSELTVREFIFYMADLKKIKKQNRKAAVEKVIEETGLRTVQNKLTRNLSRGYKQRVSLAGALVGEPKILILDEPTVGLDPKQVVEIRELIKSLRKNHTVILSSHILSEVSQICEKVVIIDKGEIVAVDTPDHLEKATVDTQRIIVNVEDPSNGFERIENSAINRITLKEEKDDGTKVYEVSAKADTDIRKILFNECSKNNITLLEMKQEENSLEDAFIKLVDNRPELSFKEQKKLEYDREIEMLRQEEKAHQEKKAAKKQAKAEEKARKADKKGKATKKEEKVEPKEKVKEEIKEEAKEEKTAKKASTKKSKKEENK